MPHKIETDFIVDYSEEEPRRLVRLVMDVDAVATLRRCLYAAGDYGKYLSAPQSGVDEAYGLSAFFRNVETELSAPSLFSLEEFKATNPQRDETEPW